MVTAIVLCMSQTITLAHSPDSDDAFMFYALAKGLVDTHGLTFRHELHDIETLNQQAEKETFDITAVSFHGYAYVSDRYQLMTAGASVGDGYGPVVVAKRPLATQDLSEVVVGIPGEHTTATLALNLLCPGIRTKVLPFDEIPDEVLKGNIDAGLLIHEGQVTFHKDNLCRIVDLGEWWKGDTGLPLPLGANAIRKSLDRKTTGICCDVLKATIQYALDHREDALDYALAFGRGLNRSDADKFVGMYVNGFTLELGERGEQAADLLLRLGHEKGLIPTRITPQFVG